MARVAVGLAALPLELTTLSLPPFVLPAAIVVAPVVAPIDTVVAIDAAIAIAVHPAIAPSRRIEDSLGEDPGRVILRVRST